MDIVSSNMHILDGTTVENKGKLIATCIIPMNSYSSFIMLFTKWQRKYKTHIYYLSTRYFSNDFRVFYNVIAMVILRIFNDIMYDHISLSVESLT